MKNKFLKFLPVILFIIGSFLVGYGVGANNNPNVITNTEKGKPREIDFSMFWEVWNYIDKDYVSKNPDQNSMFYGALSGMVDSLKDPYTTFLNPEESKALEEDLSGSFGGIGVEIEGQKGQLIVISAIDGSPAQKSGIKSQDIIVKIDDKDVNDYSYNEAINKIRGDIGSIVKITVYRQSSDQFLDFNIERKLIDDKSVSYEFKNNNILYLRIKQFGEDTFDLTQKALEEARNKNITKVVLDLRDNPGGYFETGINVASLFLKDGSVVVKEQNRDGNTKEYKTSYLAKLSEGEIIVLLNSGSASAAEIVAGALKDNGRAQILGQKSYGKGTVQELKKLSDGSELKITVAKWLTPNGSTIDKEGIKPDIDVENTDGRDQQLQKALDELK